MSDTAIYIDIKRSPEVIEDEGVILEKLVDHVFGGADLFYGGYGEYCDYDIAYGLKGFTEKHKGVIVVVDVLSTEKGGSVRIMSESGVSAIKGWAPPKINIDNKGNFFRLLIRKLFL